MPGPVFVHAERCERFAQGRGYPAEMLPYGAVLEGYDGEQRVIEQRRVTDGSHEAGIVAILGNPAVRYVMVRDLKARCFDLRAVRREKSDE